MALYKVIQDIEAEDKFVGPLTLRQFIFAAIAVASSYASFYALTKGIWLVLALLSPIILFSGFFAWPFGRDQPTEVWALAKLRFLIKPRRRIWDQSGMKQLVTVTAPKKIERHLTDGLSQVEVKSRLQALASTLDSRGWAVKNVATNVFAYPDNSDRLVSAGLAEDNLSDPYAANDIMDVEHNATAYQLDALMQASEQARRKDLLATVKSPAVDKAPAQAPPMNYWFMNEPAKPPAGQDTFGANPVVTAGSDDQATTSVAKAAEPTANDKAVIEKVKAEKAKPNLAVENMHTLRPADTKQSITDQKASAKTSAATPNPDILRLASNDDLNVATIARQANKATDDASDGEVVISLR